MDARLLTGNALDDSTIEFEVMPDGVTLAHDRPAKLFEDVPCTDEMAAAWH